MSATTLLMNASEKDIAQQLTLIEFAMFSRIQPAELISQAWNGNIFIYLFIIYHIYMYGFNFNFKLGSVSRQRAPHVVDLIQRTNRISFWIASLLLWQPTQHMRLKMLNKTINIGVALKELNNYNTLMGIVAGIYSLFSNLTLNIPLKYLLFMHNFVHRAKYVLCEQTQTDLCTT